MAISYIYTGQPMTGTGNDDFFIGYKGSTGTDDNTINAGDGDDLVIGDSSDTWIPNASYNNGSIATAFNLETLTSTWTTAENEMFGDWTIPHTTVMAETTIGQSEYYRIQIGAGQQITIDLDFASNWAIGNGRDLVVELQDSLGNVIATADDSLVSDGGLGSAPSTAGSASSYDPYLVFTVATAGIYYINVRPFGGGPSSTFTDNNTFVMNVSVTGHAVNATNPVQGADTINGGDGDDALFGQGGADVINGGNGNDFIDSGSGGDIVHGDAGNDTIYGGDGTEENIHGDAGDDILHSGGEGHYYGDDGNDVIYAGLTSGVNEILDGGTGIDTLDTTTWNGTYVVNLVTGVTNFGESFINFENIVTGNGADTITGTGGANVITTQGGADIVDAGAGDDTITGGAGADSLTGGAGNDTFIDTKAGLSGDTITDFSGGDRIVITDANIAGFTFSLSGNTLTYTGGSLTLSSVPAGHIVAKAAPGGGVLLQHEIHNDFNGDGRSDVLLNHVNGSVTDWLGQADGTFFSNHAAASYALPAGWHIGNTGDFNGDGRSDILLRHDNGSVTEWLGQAGGGFAWNAAATYGLDPAWHVASTGDFNGDGRDDLLLRHDNGSVTDWLGQADGTFFSNHAAASYALPAGWGIAASGDFNGDGRSDVLLRNANGSVTEWLGQANGGFAWNAAATYGLDSGWAVAGTGDVNGDGRDDIVLRYSSGTVIDWLGQADGTFFSNHANTTYALDPGWKIAEAGDFNGDGRADLLLRHDNGSITEWLGQANGGFTWNSSASYGLDSAWHVQDPLL